MKRQLVQLWTNEDGILSFEWVLLVTLLVIGVVGGLTAARDGVVDELGDAAQAILSLDDSYRIDNPLLLTIDGTPFPGGTSSQFIDSMRYTDCQRTGGPNSDDAVAEFSDSDS